MSSGTLRSDATPEVDLSNRRETVLELDGLEKSYDETPVIRDLSLSVYDGELLTLLGPSGCEIGRASCRERV